MVPERVIGHMLGDPGPFQRRLAVVPPLRAWPIWLLSLHGRRRKDPAVRIRVRAALPPREKRLGSLRVQRHVLLRRSRLRRTLYHRNHRSADVRNELLEIHIVPAQTDKFASAQLGERTQFDHRAKKNVCLDGGARLRLVTFCYVLTNLA